MSISAILAKAFSTTLLGMGTVFALLIVISLIIGWLRYIPAVLDRLQKPKSTAAAGSKRRRPQKACRRYDCSHCRL